MVLRTSEMPWVVPIALIIGLLILIAVLLGPLKYQITGFGDGKSIGLVKSDMQHQLNEAHSSIESVRHEKTELTAQLEKAATKAKQDDQQVKSLNEQINEIKNINAKKIDRLSAENQLLSQKNEDLNADFQQALAKANMEIERLNNRLINMSEKQDCLDFSGTWKSLDLPVAQAEIMNLTQSECQITGTISGGPRHVVKGEVKSGILYMDIERTTVQGGSDCLNILRSTSRKHPGDETKLVRTITEILGNCGKIGPATQLPVVNYHL